MNQKMLVEVRVLNKNTNSEIFIKEPIPSSHSFIFEIIFYDFCDNYSGFLLGISN